MSGDQEVPPTTTGGLGTGTLSFNSSTLAISGGFTLNGVAATAAHIHQAAATFFRCIDEENAEHFRYRQN